MTDYVPTTDEVETAFHEFASGMEYANPGSYEDAPEFADWRQAMHGFRRWLKQVRYRAWEEGQADALVAWSIDHHDPHKNLDPNPYRN